MRSLYSAFAPFVQGRGCCVEQTVVTITAMVFPGLELIVGTLFAFTDL